MNITNITDIIILTLNLMTNPMTNVTSEKIILHDGSVGRINRVIIAEVGEGTMSFKLNNQTNWGRFYFISRLTTNNVLGEVIK